jgi:outer membrane protein TolC
MLGDVAEEQQKAQVLQVSHEARIAFYDYAHARGGEEVALASVKVLEASVSDLEGLVQVGASTPTELARTRAALANARAMATQMQGLVEVTMERLHQIMGEPVKRERGIGEPLIGIELGDPPAVEQVVGEARSSRPELKALRALEQARIHFARARRGSVLPQISGVGGVYYMSPHQRYFNLTDDFKTTWEAGVRLTWSPNDAAYNYTQASDAESELRMVQEDLRAFEQHIAVESASAVTSYRTAGAHIDAATEKLEAARRYHADQRALMLAGAATPNDVLLAERDLTAAALEWVDAFIEARRAQADLLKAQGKTGLAQTSPTTSSSSRSTP